MTDGPPTRDATPPGRGLSAYLLGTLDFETFLALQRRLVYDVAGDLSAAVILCDHPPGITVGREGSRTHIRPGPDELNARGWGVRWVSRGGGAVLHQPGQVAFYPVLPLDALGLTVKGYLDALQGVVLDLLAEYQVKGEPDPDRPGVRVRGRPIVHVGVAVRGGVTGFGVVLNADPDLEPFRAVRCDSDPAPMTSLLRESPLRVRVPGVRQRLLDLLAARLGFARVSLFHTHPGLTPRAVRHAVTTRP